MFLFLFTIFFIVIEIIIIIIFLLSNIINKIDVLIHVPYKYIDRYFKHDLIKNILKIIYLYFFSFSWYIYCYLISSFLLLIFYFINMQLRKFFFLIKKMIVFFLMMLLIGFIKTIFIINWFLFLSFIKYYLHFNNYSSINKTASISLISCIYNFLTLIIIKYKESYLNNFYIATYDIKIEISMSKYRTLWYFLYDILSLSSIILIYFIFF